MCKLSGEKERRVFYEFAVLGFLTKPNFQGAFQRFAIFCGLGISHQLLSYTPGEGIVKLERIFQKSITLGIRNCPIQKPLQELVFR